MRPKLVRLADLLPAGSWAMAMGCGIVSIDLYAAGQPVLSDILFWLAAAVWAVLAVRWAMSPATALRESTAPSALGSVAATSVLGARCAALGASTVAAVLLVLATAALGALLWPVLRHWSTPTVGASFLVTVAIQGVAVLAATLAATASAGWLLYAATALFVAGLIGYALVLRRFDFGAVGTGAGDQWVAGGALAISTLAAGKITASAAALGAFGRGWPAALKVAALVLWSLAMVWLLALVVSELIRPRLRYHVLRWATVFPVGMYAACSFAVGQVTGLGGITNFARIWTPVAAAVTLAVLIGLIRRIAAGQSGQSGQSASKGNS